MSSRSGSLEATRARRDEHGARRGAVPRRMLEIQSGVLDIYTGVARVLINPAFEYGFLKVRLPSHSDRIADITEGPSRAKELNRSRGRFPGESSHEAHWRPA